MWPVGKAVTSQYWNFWSSVKTNRSSVNDKYANLTRHSSSLLDLDNDSRVSIIGVVTVGVEVEDKPMCSEWRMACIHTLYDTAS
jgi:hypothetical protein